ncbi:MAG: cardiolipin synthase [Firmicutes bacterium]|nr:cardiolipin synthase [Bacillota bacterium]
MTMYLPVYIAYLFAIISLIFFSRKKPLQRFSWILILVLVPVIGLILYLLLGSDSFQEYRKRRIFKRHGTTLNSLESIVCSAENANDNELLDLELPSFLHKFCGSNFTADNDVKLFTDGASKYEALFHDLHQASDNIHVQYFTIQNDEVGQQLLNILVERAEAGVEVKLLYDGIGSLFSFFSPLIKRLKNAGGKVSIIRPYSLDINYRNHRKIVVIDGVIGYTGGMNVGAEYKFGVREKPWRDTHLRITGSAVHYLQKIFLSDWTTSRKNADLGLRNELLHYFPEPDKKGNLGAQIVANGLYNKYSNNDIMNFSYLYIISRAKRRVWIQTPYLAPSDPILQTLKALASTGVDVRIMTSASYAFGGLFHNSITNYFLRYLVDSGVRVFKYNGVMHAKTLLIDDDAVSIGTVNLNARSLGIDDELYVCFQSPEFVKEYRLLFEKDLLNCVELDYTKFREQCFTSRIFESVMSFFSSVA